MATLLDDLKITCGESRSAGLRQDTLRIRLKEKLQLYVLDYIYNSPEYNHLVLYGGTALRVCFNLNRMSEDIDFETTKPFDKGRFAKEIKNYFTKKIQYGPLSAHVPGRGVERVELRFPLLHELGLSPHEKENLIVKVEVNKIGKNYPTAFKTVAEGRFGFVIRHYIFQVLMAGKILACLDRIWEKSGVKIKGRDFYDLAWYMQQGIIPDRDYLRDAAHTVGETFGKLRKKISAVKSGDLLRDLIPLFENSDFAAHWTERFKEQFASLDDRYQTAPVDKNADIKTGEMREDPGSENLLIKVVCENTAGRKITFVFSFSEEWVDDEAPKEKISRKKLPELCRLKAEEYMKKTGGENIVPGRYPTRVIVTPAVKGENETVTPLTAKAFDEAPLEALLDRRKTSLS